jgi:hypothetical protein
VDGVAAARARLGSKRARGFHLCLPHATFGRERRVITSTGEVAPAGGVSSTTAAVADGAGVGRPRPDMKSGQKLGEIR